MPYLHFNYGDMKQSQFWREVHIAMKQKLNMVLIREGNGRALANSVRRYANDHGIPALVKQRIGTDIVLVTFL